MCVCVCVCVCVCLVSQTGVALSSEEVQRAARICALAGSWLVLDNTYEDFLYEDRQHTCVGAPNIINIFSFSKVCERHMTLCVCACETE